MSGPWWLDSDEVDDRFWTLVYMTWSPAERRRLYRAVAWWMPRTW